MTLVKICFQVAPLRLLALMVSPLMSKVMGFAPSLSGMLVFSSRLMAFCAASRAAKLIAFLLEPGVRVATL